MRWAVLDSRSIVSLKAAHLIYYSIYFAIVSLKAAHLIYYSIYFSERKRSNEARIDRSLLSMYRIFPTGAQEVCSDPHVKIYHYLHVENLPQSTR